MIYSSNTKSSNVLVVSYRVLYNIRKKCYCFPEASLKDLLPKGRYVELIEGIISSLIMRLIRKMRSPVKDGKFSYFVVHHNVITTLVIKIASLRIHYSGCFIYTNVNLLCIIFLNDSAIWCINSFILILSCFHLFSIQN